MKPSIRLLDCTLREAPLNDLMWGDMSIRKMLDGLKKANVDIIEVGFLKNAEYKIGSTSFCRVEEIEPYLENKNQENRDTLYAALVDYGRYNITNLSENDGKSIDIIRICFKHNEINNVIDYAQEIRDKGYKISIQHVDTLGFSDQEIVDFIEKINVFKPFAYSIVDTFGAMYEDDMLRLTRLVTEHLDENILLGFHGHNNLMLADANSQKFIEQVSPNRNIIVDSSLYGCGRSAGNAHTELMAQYLNKKFSANYNIDEMLDLIDTVIATAQEKTSWGYSIPYFIAGMHDAHTFNAKQLLKRHNLRSKDLRGILGLLNDTQKKAYDYALLEKLYIEYFDKPIDDQESIQKLRKAWQGRTILLLAPGKTVQEYKYNIEVFIKENDPIIIAVNNLIEGYKMDYIFYSGKIRYYNLQYQNYKAAGSPIIILSSNIKTVSDDDEIIVDYHSLIKFGWINIDSSAILLMRLLQRCNINNIYIAGMDGYERSGQAFYSNELDTGLDETTRIEHTQDNFSMIQDMQQSNPNLEIHFITKSVYEGAIV